MVGVQRDPPYQIGNIPNGIPLKISRQARIESSSICRKITNGVDPGHFRSRIHPTPDFAIVMSHLDNAALMYLVLFQEQMDWIFLGPSVDVHVPPTEIEQIARKYKLLYNRETHQIHPFEEADREIIAHQIRNGKTPVDLSDIVRQSLRYSPELFRILARSIHLGAPPAIQVQLSTAYLYESDRIFQQSRMTNVPFRERVRSLGAWYRHTYLDLPRSPPVDTEFRTCYDYVEMLDVSLENYLSQDPFQIVLVQSSPTGRFFATGSNKKTILQTTKSFYRGLDNRVVDTSVVLYQLQGRFPFYVSAQTLNALLVSRYRTFLVQDGGPVYPLTIGVDTYHGRGDPFDVGVAHCTPGTDKRVSTLLTWGCRTR